MSIHNMIHAEIESAELGVHGAVNINLSGDRHILTIFQESTEKAEAIVDAINDAIRQHETANTEQSSPPA